MLLRLFLVFLAAEKIAGLKLKDVKCVIVPLGADDFATAAEAIKRWLSQNIPDWQHFKIAPCAKLLGFFIGPGATDEQQWSTPLAKWTASLHAVCSAPLPPAMLCREVGARVHTTLSYVAQLVPPPAGGRCRDNHALNKV